MNTSRMQKEQIPVKHLEVVFESLDQTSTFLIATFRQEKNARHNIQNRQNAETDIAF